MSDIASEVLPVEKRVQAVRAFNRFYTRQIGVLNEGLLNSAFSLTEVRVLYELAHADGITAKELAETLALDPGYLSRIIKGFNERGFLEKQVNGKDQRLVSLKLTSAGQEAFAP